MTWWLVRIRDKELPGEPHVAFAIVESPTEQEAIDVAEPLLETMAAAGRGRCHAVATAIQSRQFYRTGRYFRCGVCDTQAYLERG